MGIWNSTLVYVGARTLLAGAMIALLLRRQVGPWYAGGQVVSDLSCAAFLLAYVNADVREDVGWLVVPLLLFVLYWEATRFLENRRAAASSEEEDTWLDTAFNTYGWIWTGGFVVPAVLAGCFVMFDLVAPQQWPFPNPRPDIACTPRRLRSGGELTVRMRVPHGSQLTVFRPNGEAVQLIPYGVRSFEQLARFTLDRHAAARIRGLWVVCADCQQGGRVVRQPDVPDPLRRPMITRIAFVAVGLTACASPPESQPVGDIVPIQEVYSLPSFSGLTETTAALIVDSAGWEAAWASIFSNYGPSQRPPLPAIDFDSSVVLYAGTGEVPTQLYSFKITEVRLSDAGTLNVRVESVWPTCGSLPVITSPVHVISVPVRSTDARFTWVKSGKCD